MQVRGHHCLRLILTDWIKIGRAQVVEARVLVKVVEKEAVVSNEVVGLVGVPDEVPHLLPTEGPDPASLH